LVDAGISCAVYRKRKYPQVEIISGAVNFVVMSGSATLSVAGTQCAAYNRGRGNLPADGAQ